MPHRSHRWYWILLGLLVVLGLPHACQKDDPVQPEPAANLRIARLEADRHLLGPDDSTRVRAWVVQGPEPGTPGSRGGGRLLGDAGGRGRHLHQDRVRDRRRGLGDHGRSTLRALPWAWLRCESRSEPASSTSSSRCRPVTQDVTTLERRHAGRPDRPAGRTARPNWRSPSASPRERRARRWPACR